MIRFSWILLAFLCCFTLSAQQDSLKQVISSLEGTEQLELMRKHIHSNQNDTDHYLLDLCLQGLDKAQTNDEQEFICSFQRLQGSLLMARRNFDSAEVCLNRAFSNALQWHLNDELGEIQGVLGSLYYRQQKLESAVEYWIPTLNYLENTKKMYSYGIRLTQIGNAYLMLGEIETGVKYNKKALEVDELMERKGMQARVLISLGYGYDEMNKYDSALHCYNRAFEVAQKDGDAYRMVISLINKTSALEAMGNYKEALEASERTLGLLHQYNMKEYLPHVYTTLINLNLNTENPDEALQLIDSVAYYLEEFPDESIAEQLNAMRSKAYENLGEFQKSLRFFKLHSAYQDSVQEASQLASIEELRISYETEKKDQLLEVAQKDRLILEEKSKRNQYLWVSITVLILLLFGMAILFLNRRLLKKQKESAEQEVLHQLEVLSATINGQENERKRIAQELHDGIGQQITAIKLMHESISKQVDEQSKTMSELIQHTAQDVRNLSHQMMPKTLQDLGLSAAIQEVVDSIKSQENIKVQLSSTLGDYRPKQQVEINLYRIFQELISNAIKHAEASSIEILLYLTDEHLILAVSDDGKGMQSQGDFSGHGMTNISTRASVIGASYHIESDVGKGFSLVLRVAR